MADPVVDQKINTVQSGGVAVGVVHADSGVVYVGGQHYDFSLHLSSDATTTGVDAALRIQGVLERLKKRDALESFVQLLDIVRRVTQRATVDLPRIYYATLPQQTVRPPLQTTMPIELLSDLCEWQNRNGWPPLFEFVERLRLTEGIDQALSSELQQWVDANAARQDPPLTVGEIQNLRKFVRAVGRRESPEVPLCLQVCLEPDLLNRTIERKQPLFRVYAVLRNPDSNIDSTLEVPGESKGPWTLEELPSLLDEMFFANQQYVNETLDIRQLMIEVVAPSDVLLYAFEHWKHNDRAYGADYPLVVRLLDRLVIADLTGKNRALNNWKDKWNTFQDFCFNGCEALEWRAQDELDEYELAYDPELTCLGLSFPLQPDKLDVFKALQAAGIPVAIWLRGSDLEPVDPASLPERIQELIEGKPLSDLYKTVQRVRRKKEVRENAKHIGNALTLLWDDPNRIPPKYDGKGTFR